MVSRRELRQGGGRGTGDDHFDEVEGSTEFEIFLTPNKRAKGYEALKRFLESEGCHVAFPAGSSNLPGPRYQAVRVTSGDEEIPAAALRRGHRWAHQRNLLHSFFKPTVR